MTVPLRFGVIQLSMEPTATLADTASVCEEQGFDSFWLGEAYPWWRKHGYEARSATAISAVIANRTRRILLGWGIISPYTRHPVQIAMEARVLQDLAPDRFLLGLGASRIFMRHAKEGASGAHGPTAVLREAVHVVRGVLAGQPFTFEGANFRAAVEALDPGAEASTTAPPIYMAGTGPNMQRLAGEVADGLLTASITTPAFLRWAAGNLAAGAAAAGRDAGGLDLGAVIVASIDEDEELGTRGAREIAAMYLANKVQNIGKAADTLLEKAGIAPESLRPVADALDRGGRRAAAAALDQETFEKAKPIAGTPKQCIERIEEYIDAGCRHFLLELWGDHRTKQVALFGEHVLPHFRRER
jgi:5,10-methylenetetrahydromethanopterin reductase